MIRRNVGHTGVGLWKILTGTGCKGILNFCVKSETRNLSRAEGSTAGQGHGADSDRKMESVRNIVEAGFSRIIPGILILWATYIFTGRVYTVFIYYCLRCRYPRRR